MSVNAIGAGHQNSQVNKLNAEIKQAEAEIKEALREVQKAAAESIGGSSDTAQLLQSKILMQQQEIITKQMQVKEIESPEAGTTEQMLSIAGARPRFDRYVAEKEESNAPDNVYRLEEKDGTRQVIFNRSEE